MPKEATAGGDQIQIGVELPAVVFVSDGLPDRLCPNLVFEMYQNPAEVLVVFFQPVVKLLHMRLLKKTQYVLL